MSNLILPSKSRIILPNRKVIAPWRRPIRRRGGGGSVTYEQAVLADSPLGWWRCNDANQSAVLLDSSGHGANGDILVVPELTYQAPGLIVTDAANKAFSCVDTDQIAFAGPAVFGIGAAFTIEYWIKPAAPLASGYNAMSLLAGDFTTFGIQIYESGVAGGGRASLPGEAHVELAAGTYVVGSAMQMFITYDGVNVRVYKDTVLIGGPASWASPIAVSLIYFSYSDYGISASGTIDEVSVYGTALSQARAVAHYNAAMGI